MIDERGRLFGVINLIDAGVAVLLGGLLVAVGVGYSVFFRLPKAPEVARIAPATQPAGPSLRVTLNGTNFLPFMRAVIQRTGDSARAVRNVSVDGGVDRYALVNTSQARFFLESPSLAEVLLPEGIEPGIYDLVLFNETERVIVKEAAFTITPPPAGTEPATPPSFATVRAYGTFSRVGRPGSIVGVGTRFTTGVPGESAEVLWRGAAGPDVVNTSVPAVVTEAVRIPAIVRITCSVTGLDCRVHSTTLARDVSIGLLLGDRSYTFVVTDLVPDAAETVRQARVTVRFVAPPEVAGLVKQGDIDGFVPTRTSVLPAESARIAAIGARRTSTSNTQVPAANQTLQTFAIPEAVVLTDVVVVMPVTRSSRGWFYKGQSIRAGGTFSFETDQYSVAGLILSVDTDRGAAPAANR